MSQVSLRRWQDADSLAATLALYTLYAALSNTLDMNERFINCFGTRHGPLHCLKPCDPHKTSNSTIYVPCGGMTLLLLLIPHNYMGLPQQLLSHSSRGQLEGGSQTLPGRLGGRSDTQLAHSPSGLLYTPRRDLPPAQSNVCRTSMMQTVQGRKQQDLYHEDVSCRLAYMHGERCVQLRLRIR